MSNVDLHIDDFELIRLRHFGDIYFIPIYILTDYIVQVDDRYFETMIRVGFDEKYDFLNFSERCITKLEAFKQHKVVYKKLLKGFFDNEIIEIVEKEGLCNVM